MRFLITLAVLVLTAFSFAACTPKTEEPAATEEAAPAVEAEAVVEAAAVEAEAVVDAAAVEAEAVVEAAE